MAKIPPFHSIMQKIYHDDTTCTDARTIQTHHKRQGTAGKQKCYFCQRLNVATNSNKELKREF